MKIRLPSYQALNNVPKEMRELWRNFGLLVETLTPAFQRGLSLEDNMSHELISLPVANGVQTRVAHGLKRRPQVALVVNGRVEFMQILELTANDVLIRPRLITTTCSAPTLGFDTRTLTTPDAAFFGEGDVVNVNSVTNTVVSSTPTQLRLSRAVAGVAVTSVSLAVEEITLLLL